MGEEAVERGLLLVLCEEVLDDQEALFFVRSELGVGDAHLSLVGVDRHNSLQ